MQVDASRSVIGAVLIQDGCQLHPLQSHLHQFNKYALIKQEMLAVVYICHRFHQ